MVPFSLAVFVFATYTLFEQPVTNASVAQARCEALGGSLAKVSAQDDQVQLENEVRRTPTVRREGHLLDTPDAPRRSQLTTGSVH
eukprot:4585908-Prymnesium_polylepis.1